MMCSGTHGLFTPHGTPPRSLVVTMRSSRFHRLHRHPAGRERQLYHPLRNHLKRSATNHFGGPLCRSLPVEQMPRTCLADCLDEVGSRCEQPQLWQQQRRQVAGGMQLRQRQQQRRAGGQQQHTPPSRPTISIRDLPVRLATSLKLRSCHEVMLLHRPAPTRPKAVADRRRRDGRAARRAWLGPGLHQPVHQHPGVRRPDVAPEDLCHQNQPPSAPAGPTAAGRPA